MEKSNSKRILVSLLFGGILLAAVALLTGVPGCGKESGTEKQTLTMGTFLKAMGNAPYHVAKYKGWFNEEPELRNVRFVYTEFADRPTISDAFSGEALQVLFSAEIPAILTRAQGNDIRVVDVSGQAAQEILVRSELPIKKVSELRGHSLAVLASTSSHYGLIKILTAHGMNEKDVDLRFMGPDLARVAFEKNDLDAWAVWAPWVEQQEVTGKGKALPRGEAAITSVMTMSFPFLSKHEQQARAIHRTIQRAKKWMVENPDEAKKIAGAELGLDAKVIELAWPKFEWTTQLDERSIADFQAKATFLGDQGKTRQGKELDVKNELTDLRFAGSSR